MATERHTNIVITENLYLTGLVEKDIFSDEQELVLVEGKFDLNPDKSYWKNRKEFLKEQIEKKKEVLKNQNAK